MWGWIVALGVVLALAGCAGPDSGRGELAPAGAKRAGCERACNRDYDICADSAGAKRGGGSFFGVGAACDRQVSGCLQQCKTMSAPPQSKAAGGPAAQ